MSSNVSLACAYVKYYLYATVRTLFNAVQSVTWVINGTYYRLYKNKQEQNYYRSAQLLDIIFKYKLDLVLEPASAANFISTHAAFVSPSYTLQDNVTLYYITPTEAVFVESQENIDVNHSDCDPFIRVAQFQSAQRIIKLPIEAFHKLAEWIGDPNGEVVFVTNTSRCGSTLLCQLFEETGSCVSYSEPEALNALAALIGKLPKDQLELLGRNVIRVQCKSLRNLPIMAHVLKLTAPTINAVPMFVKLYPESKQLFMYREGLKVVQSNIKVATQMPMLALTFKLLAFHPRLSEMCVESMGVQAKDFKVRLPSPMAFCVFIWALHCRKYLDLRLQGIDINAIKYEDLVAHPVESTKAIFRYCSLPEELAEKAIKALSKDSQGKSPLSMKNLSKAKTKELIGQDKITSDAICEQMGLPRIPEECNLEGTITFKGTQVNGANN